MRNAPDMPASGEKEFYGGATPVARATILCNRCGRVALRAGGRAWALSNPRSDQALHNPLSAASGRRTPARWIVGLYDGLAHPRRGARGEWIERKGAVEPITSAHILIVAPHNSQVALLADRLGSRGVRVGTVDKFQGQQAPIVIYSIATSAPECAPRGMEFLYSLNRLNVAASRAQCACILVANPRLFAPECKTPRQMKLANALCRYVEMAQHLINSPGMRVNMLPGEPKV